MAATILACGLITFFFLLWLWSKINAWFQRHKTRTKSLDQQEAALNELEAAIHDLDKVLTKEREDKQNADKQALYSLDRRLTEKRVAVQHSDEQATLQRKIELSNLDKQLTEKRELEAHAREEKLTEKREAEMRSNEQILQKREVGIINLDKRLSKEREVDSHLIEQNLNQREAELRELERVLTEKSKSFPWLAGAIADLVLLKNNEVSDYLRTKRNPAYNAAQTVSQVGREKRVLAEQLKLAQYTISVS